MQITLLDLARGLAPILLPDEVFSFRPFISYMNRLKEKSGPAGKAIISSVLEKIAAFPELSAPLALDDIRNYESILDLVYTTLLPVATEQQQHYRALTLPIRPAAFYSSDAFYELAAASVYNKPGNRSKNSREVDRMRQEFCYLLILEKCYQFTCPFHTDMSFVLEKNQTGLAKAYKVSFDTRFIDVYADELPALDIAALEAAGNDKAAVIALLQEQLSLDQFRFEGFRLMSMEDITAEYAIEEVKNQLLRRPETDDTLFSPQIETALRMLLGINKVELGLLPVFQVNNRFITTADEGCVAGAGGIALTKDAAEKLETFLMEMYLKKPKRIFFKEITQEAAGKHFYLRLLQQNGIRSYALLPVFYNETLTGILEIYTHEENHLSQTALDRLDPVIPFLSQLLQRNTDLFNNNIETVIKENFTSIQPSVQWKFNEAAWHYIRDRNKGNEPAEVENVDFEKVYPLYGSVDIRNSTVERNEALLKDLKMQFRLLTGVLQEIKSKTGFSLVDAKIFASLEWQTLIESSDSFYQQTELSDFLENDMHPFLTYFSRGNPEFIPVIQGYFAELNNETGAATRHMRQLETAMNTVIAVINKEVEAMSLKAQQAFPCFFEKFRTDGVEYDIYLGQSITPGKAYNEIYLKNMRLLQLRSMAVIARQTHALLAVLPQHVETTQLIFIHGHPIDIKFRKDERRFDVEGAYNIRYQVVKKRIDKVHIKGTQERLTVPGKIALTYFNQKEADEYTGYIRFLQQEELLSENIEYLELEPLQGVVGMRALRVSVKME